MGPYRLLKCILAGVGIALVLLMAVPGYSEPAPVKPSKRIPATPVRDSIQVAQRLNTFLQWYKTNLGTVSKIYLVNQQEGKPYAVNFTNTEQYLAYLKQSNLFTDHYLNDWRTYFAQREAGFRLNPQTEGPPIGFEYDLVMLNQDVGEQMASLNRMQVKNVTVRKGRATVRFTLFTTYDVRLVRQNNVWKINEILNLDAE
ncbi:hypothetical protein BN8_02208 [Fibrisoma limi BUZ 3]|uniref:DUF3828 domain-containing protein n=1 Tax=Fibrisoma limi BUZ 3 TaxID=1185876 RepID=I2GGW1_9BACT|nr:hypothetical protein [Fibrisoma limi]CCH53136.1 hypothetical protein BN8_02208 [Fibrisoma limi BUZ 3]